MKKDAIREAVRAFAQEQIRPRSAAFEAAGGYPPALFEELAGLGLMGMTAPESFGGAEADFVSYALALIEIAAAGILCKELRETLLEKSIQQDLTSLKEKRFREMAPKPVNDSWTKFVSKHNITGCCYWC